MAQGCIQDELLLRLLRRLDTWLIVAGRRGYSKFEECIWKIVGWWTELVRYYCVRWEYLKDRRHA